MGVSPLRYDYHENVEASVNQHVNLMLFASYVYLSMGFHFAREDAALPGFSLFFKKMSKVKYGHAEEFMEYQNRRGGRIVLRGVKAPRRAEFNSALDGVEEALSLEREVYESLENMYKVSANMDDPHLSTYLKNMFDEEIMYNKTLAGMVTGLKRAGDGLGEYLFDRDLAAELQGDQGPRGWGQAWPGPSATPEGVFSHNTWARSTSKSDSLGLSRC